jgi:hypothetical protein
MTFFNLTKEVIYQTKVINNNNAIGIEILGDYSARHKNDNKAISTGHPYY